MLKDVLSQIRESNRHWSYRLRTRILIGLVFIAIAKGLYLHAGPALHQVGQFFTRLLW